MATRKERARQFLPFDALTGLKEALKLKEEEIEYEEKIELTDEVKEEISNILQEVSKGDKLKIKYYNNNRYDEIEIVVDKIDNIKKKIYYQNENYINISDILIINKK